MKGVESFYLKNYKLLALIPIIVLAISLAFLGFNYIKYGDVIEKDVSLKGGLTITIATDKYFPDLGAEIKSAFTGSDVVVKQLEEFGTKKRQGVIIEASGVKEPELKKWLGEKFGMELTGRNYSVEEMGSSLGASFYNQMVAAIGWAFLFMAIVVFISFRTFIPSIAVIFAAFTDMIVALAVISYLDVRLSTSGIAALLLLIGYSIDTDILLTTKLLKRKEEGHLFARYVETVKTGLTMTFATLGALGVGYFLSTSFVLKEMFMIIAIGLVVDIFSTYWTNAGMLIWYIKRKYG